MKKLVTLCAATTVALGLVTAPVWANDAVAPQSMAAGDNAVKTTVIKKMPPTSQEIQQRIQNTVDQAKEKRDAELQKLNQRQDALQTALDNAAKRDSVEKANLDEEIQKWTENQKKTEAALTNRLTKIDTNLTNTLSNLDKKIAAAKTDAVKQTLTAQKTTVQNQAAAQKAAVSKYLETLKGIWADRQKVWDLRKDLLTRRQAADTELRKALGDIKVTEINDKKAAVGKSDDQIQKEKQEKYQKALDAAKAREAKKQGQPAPVPPAPNNTETSKVPVQDGTTTPVQQ